MRSSIVFVLLLISAGLFVVLQLTREPVPHAVTVAAAPKADKADDSGDTATKTAKKSAGAKGSKATKAGKAGDTTDPVRAPGIRPEGPKTGPVAAKPPKPRMKRPLRVMGLGWELITPGVVANDGAKGGKKSLFTKERLKVELSAAGKLALVEAALARGGADKLGADVAILPLPALVAAYDRLRALKPQMLFVVGWSRGRDGLLLKGRASLKTPPRSPKLIGKPGDAATLLSAQLLTLAGVDPKRIKLVDATSIASRRARYRAAKRPLPRGNPAFANYKFVATSADARYLLPIVAVAPAGFIKAHRDALTVWGHVWLQGIDRMAKDVPGAARKVAALQNGPHALELLKRLGQIQPASLGDNARIAGLSGRSPIDLGLLFRRFWRLWRAMGVLSAPAPEKAPLSVETLSALARTYPALVEAAPPDMTGGKAKRKRADGEQRLLLRYRPRLRRWDQRKAVEELGLLAAIFDRAKLRVSVRGSLRRARKLVAATTARYTLPDPERLEARSHDKGRLLQISLSLVD
jgi:hypothetical protein